MDAKFSSILYWKTYFFYFTHPFVQNTHISLSILHIYSIKYSFFYNFLLFPLLLPLSLIDPQSVTTNNHSTPSHHHQHHHHATTIIKENPLNPKPINHPPNPKPNQVKSSPTQSATRSSKPNNQWTRIAKPIKIKTHQPTPTINQKKKLATNRSKRD